MPVLRLSARSRRLREGRCACLLCAMAGRLGSQIDWTRIAALGLLAGLLGLRVIDPVPVQIVRNLTFDAYQQIEPRAPGSFPVAILDIDDPSITEIGQWPWPRNRIAEMVERATADGAVAIAFDIVFAEPDRLSPPQIAADNPDLPEDFRDALSALPGNDAALARTFATARVIVGQTSVRSALAGLETARTIPEVSHAVIGPDPLPFLVAFPDLVENLPELEAAAAGRGVFNVRPDPDGVFRRVPLVMSVENRVRLGLSPELLRVATGGEPFAIRTNAAGIDGVVLAGRLVRTAGDGTVRPYLTRSDPARFISAADLLEGRVPPGRLAGHLVLVGTSAIGLEDFRATPLGIPMAGVEIHAQLLENILSDTLLVRPNYAIAVELVGALVLCLLVIVLTPALSAAVLIGASVVLLGAVGLGSYALFQGQRILLDPSFPMAAGLVSMIFMSSANYLREERRRRRIRTAFGQYVSRDLVDRLAESEGSLTLGGETRQLTLLFSDVRGFTAIAESFREDPAALTQLMNRLLTSLSNAILERGGTIDKFMGDAVMAFWNAPLDHPEHARSACAAALGMIAAVDRLNADRSAEAQAGGPAFLPMNVGIGINTGTCTVGNMGSDMRFDYTAVGDPVNLASRLEGQSQTYGCPVIVGSATEAAARDAFAFLEIDLIRVKGKLQAERIFALLGDAAFRGTPAFGDAAAANARMLDAYRAQDWDGAAAALAEVEALSPRFGGRLAGYLALYRRRIAGGRAAPPGEGWDGVYDATNK
jgi:adenylate cyclase